MVICPDMLGWYFIAGGHQINYPVKGVWESTYFAYAQSDLNDGHEKRNLLNAVSNAKRALHYQVDALSIAFGWNQIKKRDNFPSKLEFISKCGVTAPSIIRRINKFRNTIEHDYYLPTKDEAQEYLDIVELYLLATHKVASDFPDQPSAELMSDDEDYDQSLSYPRYIDIYLPEGAGKIKVCCGDEVIIELGINDPEYFEWVSMLVRQAMA